MQPPLLVAPFDAEASASPWALEPLVTLFLRLILGCPSGGCRASQSALCVSKFSSVFSILFFLSPLNILGDVPLLLSTFTQLRRSGCLQNASFQ